MEDILNSKNRINNDSFQTNNTILKQIVFDSAIFFSFWQHKHFFFFSKLKCCSKILSSLLQNQYDTTITKGYGYNNIDYID